ncbi:MAG: OmpA family protein [Geobacteraceae bacterium]|nr:OmpA family protein [Geobacteraceae bacterium]
MKKTLLFATAGILAAASFASAANLEGQFSVSPLLGGYTYEGRQHLDTSLVYGLRSGYNVTKHLGVEALFDYVNTEKNEKKVDMYRYGGEVLYHFFPDNQLVPYVAGGFAGLNFNEGRVRSAFDYGVGVKYFLNDSVALRGDVRHILYTMNDRTNSNLEYTLGAYIPFGGVKPAVKPVAPVELPPAPKAAEPPAPAPAPAVAPTATLTITPATVTKGQSAILNWKSRNAERCDIQPGVGPVPPQGARPITPATSTSYNLTCSGAGGATSSAAGVTVVLPPPVAVAVPAPLKPRAAERFCGKPAIVVVEFDTNKSDIKMKYDKDLSSLGTFLKEWPQAKGEISGHTDNVGSAAYNLKLSQHRAASVKKYLVEKFGIASDRLTTAGYGKTRPIASNKTKAGRQQNRRIETNFSCD